MEVKYNEDGTILVSAKDVTDHFVVPKLVTELGQYAFKDCVDLNSIVFPNTMKRIGFHAFSGCENLKDIEIPSSITEICLGAFEGCHSLPIIDNIRYAGTYAVEAIDKTLKEYTLKVETKFIGSNIFKDCTNLESIEIPDTVIDIGRGSFRGCTSLKDVKIPKSVTRIDWSAFDSCVSLNSIVVPDSVTTIWMRAFYGCSNLKQIKMSDSITCLGKDAFSGCNSLPVVGGIRYADTCAVRAVDEDATEYTIKEGTKYIDSFAFYGLFPKSIIIPASVKFIGAQTFWLCKTEDLHIHIRVTDPNSIYLMRLAFNDMIEDCTLYVPIGSGTLYREHPVFSKFKAIIEE